MREYLDEKNIDRHFGQKSAQEMLNEARSDEPPTEKQYSNDPDYSQVESEIFEYLEEIE